MAGDSPAEKAPVSSRSERRRRRLRKALLALGVYTLASFLFSLIPGPVPTPTMARVRTDGWQSRAGLAGVGRADISPRQELWADLNLFGEPSPIKGVAQPIKARALALGDEDGTPRVLIVSCELTFITRQLRDAVLEQLNRDGLDRVHLLLVATHTHAAPGNYWQGWVGERICGSFSQEYFDYLVEGIVGASRMAAANMEPVSVTVGTRSTSHLVKHTTLVDPGTGRRAAVDNRLEVMALRRADGSLLAALTSFPAHPLTLLHETDGQVAGDYPGELCRLIEAEHPSSVALFLPGAVGGARATSPGGTDGYRGQPGKFGKVAKQADVLLEHVRDVLAIQGEPLGYVRCDTAMAALPRPDAHYFPEAGPYTGVRFLGAIPAWLANGVMDVLFLPDEAVFQVVVVNDTALLGVPGDLSNRIGLKLKRWVDAEHVWPLSHANGYDLGYVLDAEEYDQGGVVKGGYERLMDVFGKNSGAFTMRALFELADHVGMRRVPGDLP